MTSLVSINVPVPPFFFDTANAFGHFGEEIGVVLLGEWLGQIDETGILGLPIDTESRCGTECCH